jgi:retron-type reverse transcriptase
MKKKLIHSYSEIVSVDNLLLAWQEFVKGKRGKRDVQQFQLNLLDNIFDLHFDLLSKKYKHGGYQAFKIYDPKPRDIHKASVRDRLVHHAVYRVLYPFFDQIFIPDSYSCRDKKGIYKAINKLQEYFYIVSQNNTKTCYALKMDIRKFFANIDHQILLTILRESIVDKNVIWLLNNIIESFKSKERDIGLPLGNLTSQLLVNVYMDKFDQFVKHKLKEKYYFRYADDFVVLRESYEHLIALISQIGSFLKRELKLEIHPDKIYIKTITSGLDFLGYVSFADHRILRTKTKKRMLKKANAENKSSYLGLLKHCNGFKIAQMMNKRYSKNR